MFREYFCYHWSGIAIVTAEARPARGGGHPRTHRSSFGEDVVHESAAASPDDVGVSMAGTPTVSSFAKPLSSSSQSMMQRQYDDEEDEAAGRDHADWSGQTPKKLSAAEIARLEVVEYLVLKYFDMSVQRRRRVC